MTRIQLIDLIKFHSKYYTEDVAYSVRCNELADTILALPLDVPSTIELVNAKRAYPMKKYPYSNISDLMANADRINTAGEGFGEGATWMLDEILKRNTP